MTNTKKNISIKLRDGGTCKTENDVYAVRCKKCDVLYVEPGPTIYSRACGAYGTIASDILQSGIRSFEEREVQDEK